jgi:hypothetical protein
LVCRLRSTAQHCIPPTHASADSSACQQPNPDILYIVLRSLSSAQVIDPSIEADDERVAEYALHAGGFPQVSCCAGQLHAPTTAVPACIAACIAVPACMHAAMSPSGLQCRLHEAACIRLLRCATYCVNAGTLASQFLSCPHQHFTGLSIGCHCDRSTVCTQHTRTL